MVYVKLYVYLSVSFLSIVLKLVSRVGCERETKGKQAMDWLTVPPLEFQPPNVSDAAEIVALKSQGHRVNHERGYRLRRMGKKGGPISISTKLMLGSYLMSAKLGLKCKCKMWMSALKVRLLTILST